MTKTQTKTITPSLSNQDTKELGQWFIFFANQGYELTSTEMWATGRQSHASVTFEFTKK